MKITIAFNVNSSISDLRGFNVAFKNLAIKQNATTSFANQPPIEDILQEIRSMNMNTIRATFYWEGYYANKTRFISVLDELANKADQYGINILYDPLHQWFISSYVKGENAEGTRATGTGFPYECIQALGIPQDVYALDPLPEFNNQTAIDIFWYNFTRNYNCTLDGINKPIWDHYKDYLNIVIDITKDHPSTLGYELLNEPFTHYIFTMEDFEGLKTFYKEIAQHIREQTNKRIFYDAPYGHTADHKYPPYQNRREAVGSLAPRYNDGRLIENLVFIHTFYDGPTPDQWAQWHINWINGYKEYIEPLGIPIFVGEWNVSKKTYPDNSPPTLEECISYMQYWKSSGWGWTYWSYTPSAYGIKDNNYNDVINPRENKTQKQILIDAINTVYSL
ncbi:MAG: cellulase family glycosylhydrolase [Candidatus Nitrosocaldaceae archaeon]